MSGMGILDVVLVYAFEGATKTPAWDKVNDEIRWLVHDKLKHFPDCFFGYTLVKSNTCTSDIKRLDSSENGETLYMPSYEKSTTACVKNMACGLAEAHKLISYRGHWNAIILLFSDGLMNKGDFFDGAEIYISKVPVHTFTLGGDAYNHVLAAIAANSPGGTFRPLPVPDKPSLSVTFSQELDSILDGTSNPSNNSERFQLNVMLVYAFDCTTTSPAWNKLDDQVFWLMHEKLKHFPGSCLGYTYSEVGLNTYTCEMKKVDPSESPETKYVHSSAYRNAACRKNMASGLSAAHEMINSSDDFKTIILLFSDGLINRGNFFDGAEDFISKVPVYTFTLGGDEYNHGLRAMAENSPGGMFNPRPVPEKPRLSVSFSLLLDDILNDNRWKIIDDLNKLHVQKEDPNLLIGENPAYMPLAYLEAITNNFNDKRILGRGGFGVVYKGVLENGDLVAVKKVLQQNMNMEKQFENEINLLMKVKHHNVVRLLGYCYETQRRHGGKNMSIKKEYLLCLEFMPKGSLANYIKDASSGLEWHKRYEIIEGVSNGLRYLHEQCGEPIMHLDLKPDNILLDEDMRPKITDFGLSRLTDQTQTIQSATISGTLGYMAPEVLDGRPSIMSDIFSLGVIIIQVITGNMNYPRKIKRESKNFIEKELQKWRNTLQEKLAYALLEKYCQQIERCIQIGLICVNKDKEKRPTMEKIIAFLEGSEDMNWYIMNEVKLPASHIR